MVTPGIFHFGSQKGKCVQSKLIMEQIFETDETKLIKLLKRKCYSICSF